MRRRRTAVCVRLILLAGLLSIPLSAAKGAAAGAVRPSLHFEVDVKGIVLIAWVPRAVAAGLLPDYLELAPQSMTDGTSHPIVFWMYRFWNTRLLSPDVPADPLPTHDFSVMIPWVQFTGDGTDCVRHQRGPFVFTPIYYSEKPWVGVLNAIVNEALGLPALFEDEPGHFHVSNIVGGGLLDARYELQGRPRMDAPVGLKEALDQPLIGWSGELGAYAYGARTYGWQAPMQPAGVHLSALAPLQGLSGSFPPAEFTVPPMKPTSDSVGAMHVSRLHTTQETYYCSAPQGLM